MATTVARGDLQAYQDSVRRPDAQVVDALRQLLGARLVAYLGGVQETRAVRQWAAGERAPSAAVMQRLRTAFHVAGVLREKDSPEVVQAWFQGMNPQLADVAPARVLREGDLAEDGPRVLAAARAWAASAA